MAVTASFQRVSVLVTSMSTWSPGWRPFTMPSSHSLFCLLTVRTIFPAGISMEAEDSSTWSTVQDTRPPTFSVSERTREPVTWLTSRVPSARASSSFRLWESAADSPSAAADSSGLPSVPSAS